MDRNEIINRVAAAVLAIVLWVYVISVVNPPTTVTVRQVPVTLLNQEYLETSKLAIAGDGHYTVDVVVSGKRKDLILTQADLTATADLNGLTPGQNYITVRVTSPNNTTVEEIRTEKIQVYVDELITAERKVIVEAQNIPSGTELSTTNLSRETINVSGARSLVNMVDHLRVVVDAAGMSVDETIPLQPVVTPVDAEGNLVAGVDVDVRYVSLNATLYTVRSVPLYTKVEGNPGLGLELLSSSIPSSVSIRGTLLDLAKVNYVDAEVLDISGITVNTELPVVPILPEGIELSASGGPLVASFTVSDEATVEFTVLSSEIALEGLPEGYRASAIGEPFTVGLTVTGGVEDLAEIAAEEIVLYADLSEVETAGEINVPIQARPAGEKTFSIGIEPEQLRLLIEAPAAQPAEDTETEEEDD